MAVSAMQNNNDCSSSNVKLGQKNCIKSENIERNCASSDNLSEYNMKQAKKVQRKPEQQIYRPGMGFQNRTSPKPDNPCKNDERKGSPDIEKSNISSHYVKPISSKSNSNLKSDENCEIGSSLKAVKNRRPDLQVYKPKQKVITKVTEIKNADLGVSGNSKPELKKEKSMSPDISESEPKKSITKSPNQNSVVHCNSKNNYTKDDAVSSSLKSSSTYSPKFESWADLVEDSDLSNARSSPDEEIYNGYGKQKVNSNTTDANQNKNEKSKRRTNESRKRLDSYHKKNLRNSNAKGNINCVETLDHNHDRNNRNKASEKDLCRPIERKMSSCSISSNADNHTNDNKFRKYCRSRTVSGSSTNDHAHENGVLSKTEINAKIKDFKDFHSSTGSNKSNREFLKSSVENNKSYRNENGTKIDKKNRREKIDPPIAPRFQKSKLNNDNHIEHTSSSRQNASGGGILKLPPEVTPQDKRPEIFEDSIFVPQVPSLPEPQVFIHKQLFDPNNPDKPEIVNIPAHPVSSHLPYANANKAYFANSNDSVKSPFINAPVPTLGYIPPPQPPPAQKLNPHYRFVHSDVHKPSVISNYLPVNEVIAPPVQCSITDSRMNPTFTRPICYNEFQPSPIESVKKRLKPIVEKNLQEIGVLERELASLLAKQPYDAALNTMKQCRWKLQLRYENIILADPKYCAEKNTEQSLWKSAFHQLIESLRKKLEEDPKTHEAAKETLLNLILEGTVFYENLLEKQQETYGFNLQRLFDMEQINTACIPEQIRIVLISTQKLLINLGDLARYKEQTCQTTNYGKARSWYLKAQQLVPKNGKPYHQLAVLAQCTNRKLDAVYYYMRSLAASNPFLSAKESLLSLFEDVKRKFEQYERKRVQETTSEAKLPIEESDAKRCEVWLKRDGSSTSLPVVVEKNIDSADIKNLSDVELNKRFVTSFLHVHGKLFTRVGMDTFHDALKQMLKEFYFVLQRSPIPISANRLLQLSAINIFAVANSSLKENGRESGGSSLMQEQALYTSMVMMSMIMERCQMLHITHKSSPEYSSQIISDDFAQLLPTVKVWTDWMSCQKCFWSPPPLNFLENFNTGFKKNVWFSFADLLTTLQEIDISDPMILHERSEGCELVILEEDCSLSGFVPLFGALQEPAYAIVPFDKSKARNCLRISRIQFFGDYLCGITPPYLEFDVEHKKFVSLLNLSSTEEQYDRAVYLNNSNDDSYSEETLDEDYITVSSSGNAESSEIQMLWSRKEALSKAKEQQEKRRAQVQAVLHKHQNQLPIVLNIQPRYLIPDTNCFVDHLKLLGNLLTSSSYHIVVPLIVINELDGLARGTRVSTHSSPEHANRVTALSQEAVTFLEQQFALRNPHLRAITSKGSVLDTISFRSEEMEKNKGTNDDLILSCCLYYCNDKAKLYMPKNHGEPVQLFREVVLLTDDRNLRIKALAHNVPVRDLLSFLQWANS